MKNGEHMEIPLTPTQRAMKAARRVEEQGVSCVEASHEFKANSVEVSHARKVIAIAVPELVAMMERGELSLYMGAKIAVLPHEQQVATIERVKTEKLLDTVDRRVLAKAMGKVPPSKQKRPEVKRIRMSGWQRALARNRALSSRVERCLDQINNAVEILGEFLDEGKKDPEMGKWLEQARKVRRALTRIITTHKEEVSDGGTDELREDSSRVHSPGGPASTPESPA